MSVFVDKLYDYIQAKRTAGYTYLGYPVYNVTKADVKLIEDTANYFGFRPEWLANLINYESAYTFNPAVTNSLGATGLIQFMPTTAPDIGTTTTALAKMTFAQQMVYVKKYLYMWYTYLKWVDADGTPIKNKMTQTDLYMMVFYPLSIGNPNYQFPADVVASNAGTKTPLEYYNKAITNAPFKSLLTDAVATVTEKAKKNPVMAIIFGVTLVGLTLSIIYRKNIVNYFNQA